MKALTKLTSSTWLMTLLALLSAALHVAASGSPVSPVGDSPTTIVDPGDGCPPQRPQFTLTPPPGWYFTPQTLRIEIDEPGIAIHYRLDGKEATETDPVFDALNPIQLDGAVTVSVMAWSGVLQEPIVQMARYDFFVGAVQAAPPPGDVEYGTTVALSTPSTALLCTSFSAVDAPEGATDWQPYVAPIVVSSNICLHVKATKPGYAPTFQTLRYSVPHLPRPDFVPVRGPLSPGTSVAITSQVPGTTIRYTLDGTEPTETSSEYTSPLCLPENSRLRARVYLPGVGPSYVRYTYYRSTSSISSNQTARSWELPHLKFTQVSGADRPVWVTSARDGTGRLFVVEQQGIVRIAGRSRAFLSFFEGTNGLVLTPDGQPPQSPRSRIASLISVAFPPDYDSKAYFYVSYISLAGTFTISRLNALDDPDIADLASEQIVASLPRPGCNSGQLVFATDGTLYANSGGPIANAQLAGSTNDLNAASGKMIPILNENGRPLPTPITGLAWPFAEHFTPNECSVIGGVLYQGAAVRMRGLYFYGDSYGTIRALRNDGAGWKAHALAQPVFETGIPLDDPYGHLFPDIRPFRISAFGEDEDGGLYVANFGASFWRQGSPGFPSVEEFLAGGIYRVDDDPLSFSLRVRRASSDSTTTLEWLTDTRYTYLLQESADLARWTNLLAPIAGTGATVSISAPSAVPDTHRFYRVLVVSD